MRQSRDERRETSELHDASARPLSLVSRLSSLDCPPSFLFAGGGSGGHLFPGIAVAEELAARDPACTIVFAGSERGIERAVLAGTGWRHEPLPVAPPALLKRKPIRFLAGFAMSVRRSLRVIDSLAPEAVVGLGGFASVPIALAARRRGVPVILLEQNVVPGRATSLLSRFAEPICLSFPETARLLPRHARWIVTGNPLRAAVLSARRRCQDKNTLLVLGGSQGAIGLNAMAVGAIVRLREQLHDWRVVHQTGERDAAGVSAAYSAAGIPVEVAPFFDDLSARYADATLAITRAGATTLAELAYAGVPAVLIPYPGSVRRHQDRNAEHYSAAGGAVTVPEGPHGVERLAAAVGPLLGSPFARSPMAEAMRRCAAPAAAKAVADLLRPVTASVKAA